MSEFGPLTFRQLLIKYALPLWKSILLLTIGTLTSSILAAAQPAIVAAILNTLMQGPSMQGPSSPEPVPSSPFDLNYLGSRTAGLLSPIGGDPQTILLALGAIYAVQAIMVSGIDYGNHLVSIGIRLNATRFIQNDLLKHLLSLSLGHFQKMKSGDLISRVTADATQTAIGLGPLVQGIIHHTARILIYGVYLCSTSMWLTIGAMLMIGIQFSLTRILKKPVAKHTRRELDAKANLSTTLQETFTSIRVSKSFGAEEFELKKLGSSIEGFVRANVRLQRVAKFEAPARAFLDSLASIGIFFIALEELRKGTLSIEGLVMFVYVGRLLITPINHMATNFVWVQALRAGFEGINNLLAQRSKVLDGPLVAKTLEKKIELKGVYFSYGHDPVLENVSFDINLGEMVALVGPSGAGKSTLADIILRLYDPDRGEVLFDGVGLREFKQHGYRRLFGVVSQESLLFHDTVHNNILYGRTDLTEEDVLRAARMANAHEFVTAFPRGYDTIVGDRGIRLSGGERQRVAIARAVVANPPILIMDEATSALDSESERLVQVAIDRIIENATAIVIAHRLSTVLHADKIVVLDNGRIVDIGRHQELIGRCALYSKLCELQFHERFDISSS